ncbi:uncharacterized protein MEPE_03288 [Melanopsichium pennsylvanicum]|uniref:Uncharacterized protein n=2 Tax=Melanopsichium pennsylvanicum TaxID=63383 RepID=A0AAJ4XKQ9_9BASI|nr:putative protein [Melanopsichium pennsylvanicum 4]SNX84579.1 uncharacterized protein MEPE_03288 [Melanopsichium pennsylvanicum]
MPTITFVTPPGRPSVLRSQTVGGAPFHDQIYVAAVEPKPKTEALRPDRTELVHGQGKEAEEQVIDPAPLTFSKRILPQLTTSPVPAKKSIDLPRSPVSLDDSTTVRPQHEETKKPSLLSTALVTSPGQAPRSASSTNLGILRRAEVDHASAETSLRAIVDATEGIVPAPRPRLHFVEPRKENVSHASARLGSVLATQIAHDRDASTAANASASATSEQPAPAHPAPRKRSLVIQEHADVLERAAERAARQTDRLNEQALEQHIRTSSFGKSRQHSTSSAGDETASTRSSWALRSNSRNSSVGTSPTIASEDNAEEPTEFELSKPTETPSVVPIFHNTLGNEALEAEQRSAPAASSRKLTFIDPAPSRRRTPAKMGPPSSDHRDSERDASSSSKKDVSAVSDDSGHTTGDSSRRMLAFAACPRPQRAAKLSPAHAIRRPKRKLSASPAPQKLAYPQRLRGVRGADPIRSPAPDRVAPISTQVAGWDEPGQDVSSEGSGYSEDEEDDELAEEEDDSGLDSNPSDIQSLTESMLQQSEDESSQQASVDSLSRSMEIEVLRQTTVNADDNVLRETAVRMLRGPGNNVGPQSGPSRDNMQRRSSTPALDPIIAANAALAAQRSPPRLAQAPRSNQTSPRSGPSSKAAQRLQPKDSFSHPMCFLPDAFEDSAPPTPTEPDSDSYEPPRTSLLRGWLSEGGSAASSRRTSWQQAPRPGLRSRTSMGDKGPAVPITLPPFRRYRERTTPHGVTSDGEQSSRSLGGNAAFILESARLGRSLNCNEERLGKRSAGGSSHASPGPQPLGISVPLDGRPSQPVMWRHLSGEHQPTERPPIAVAGHRRASLSVEPRKINSAFTSPIGSYSHSNGRVTPLPQAITSERPIRPSVGKQRAVSTSSHTRSRPSEARSVHDTVVGATSPPRDDAFTHLKHQLAQSPKAHGMSQCSGSTTPGWTSDGQLPSQNTSRYWAERLSSLAQAMSEELSMVGNAVLGFDNNKTSTVVPNDEATMPENANREPHSRSDSVPLQSAALTSTGSCSAHESSSEVPHLCPRLDIPCPAKVVEPYPPRRNSVGIRVPTKAKSAVDAWTTERDGETQPPITTSSRHRRKKKDAADESSSVDDDEQCFQFAKKQVGQDGLTRLVVIHTSETNAKSTAQ